ncbi:MAG: glycosyl hydrolase [bacterium]|nr:glycosyl hydrolase [bacterium]
MKIREQVISFGGVIILALSLPILLKLLNSVTRLLVGAEGRLAAIAVETDHPLGPMPQPWRALAQGGEELKTFLDTTGPQVAAAKPQYIRIDHIYDGFNVVSRQGEQLTFNWTELDAVVNKMLAVGAKPFFSLSYMPPAISSGDIVAEPSNYDEWALVVQKTIEHYSGEKGIENVYYEVWNEPDLFGGWKMGGRKDYKKLYIYSSRGAQAARGVRPFKFGGPATTALYKNWMDNFFPFILDNKLRLDFFSWHHYGLDIEKYTEDVDNVQRWLDSHPYFAHVEKIVSEMGPSSDKAEVNNSKVGAAHAIASARELLYEVSYGFNFSIKDAPNSTGGWGLLTDTGAVKPRYNAIAFLSRLGGERLGLTGEGTWVRAIAAQDGKTYQVLVVNYDPKGTHSEVVPVTFINLQPGTFTIKQTGLGAKTTSEQVATDAAVLQYQVAMSPNSVELLELTPLTSTAEATTSQ